MALWRRAAAPACLAPRPPPAILGRGPSGRRSFFTGRRRRPRGRV